MIKIDASDAPAIKAHSATSAAMLREPVTIDLFAREFCVPKDSIEIWVSDDGEYTYEADMVPGVPMVKVFATGVAA